MRLSPRRIMVILLVYFFPPIAYWIVAFATSSYGYYQPLAETFAAFLTRFLFSLVAYPLVLIFWQFWILLGLVVLYLAVAYGLLFLLWRRDLKIGRFVKNL